MSDTEFDVRKISTLPLRTPLLEQDLIVVVGDGTPPDGFLGSVQELAELAGGYAPAGPQGEVGPQGPAGPPGSNLDIDGSVPTEGDLAGLSVPAGSVYVVASDGSVWVYDGAAWIEMQSATGPQGPQGPPGAQGAPGPQGATGPAGAVGPAGANVPTGTVLDYAGTTAPTGFVFCDGEYYDPALPLYQPLFGVIGFTYGQDGRGFFRTPPMNGRMAVGREPLNANLGSVGRTNPITAANWQVPKHTHGPGSFSVPDHRHPIGHTHDRVQTEDASIPANSMWLQLPAGNSGPAVYVQGQNSSEWPPGARGQVLTNVVLNAGGGWAWLFSQDGGRLYLSGAGTHRHYYQPTLGNDQYSGFIGQNLSLVTTGRSAEEGVDGAGMNYPPYLVLNKIIRL